MLRCLAYIVVCVIFCRFAFGGDDLAQREPLALCLDATGDYLFTANGAQGSVSMLSTRSGAVVGELELDPVGRPSGIACAPATSPKDVIVAVAETHLHRVAFVAAQLRDDTGELSLVRRVEVERLPSALVFFGDGLFVACEGGDAVVELEARTGEQRRKIPSVEGARRICVRGDTLTVAGRCAVEQVDLRTGARVWRHELAEGLAFNLDALGVTDDAVWVGHQVRPTEMSIDPQMIVWGLVISNRLTRLDARSVLPAGMERERELSLDPRRRANGDPSALAFVRKKRRADSAASRAASARRENENDESIDRIVVASAGTDRLLFVDPKAEAGTYGYASSLDRSQPFVERRVGDRPVALALHPDGRRAFVASALDDTVREVDVREREARRTFRLRPARALTSAERGARVFFDSTRSRGGWYSCHSCHPDGGTRGHLFDTGSDDGGLGKRSPDLRGVHETGPWSWIGKFDRLEDQVATSLHRTMAVDHPASERDVRDVVRYLATLTGPRPRRQGEDLGGSPERGAEIFERSGCASCHEPPLYTTPRLRDVGIVDSYDGRRKFNPPSLRGVRNRRRYLHDGRASSLRAVFREHNAAGRHGRASKLSDDELQDLIAFLRTL